MLYLTPRGVHKGMNSEVQVEIADNDTQTITLLEHDKQVICLSGVLE